MKKDNSVQEFYISQIKTTKKIIEQFSNNDEFSPAMLINSLLSLVVLPFEKAKKKDGNKIFPGSYKDLEKKLGFNPEIFQPIKSCKNQGKIDYSNKNIYVYINKFRNGIAHQNLSISVSDERQVYISIWNKFESQSCKKCKYKTCMEKGLKLENGGVVDFKIKVTVTQLQKLSLYIADSYLKAIE